MYFPSRILLIFCIILVHGSIVLSQSTCSAYLPAEANPCSKKHCPFGAKCIPDYDHRTAECVCEKKCHSFGDSVDSRPVCGSDGKDYQNLCELNKAACGAQKTLIVRFNGSCDPCYGIKCPDHQICQIDDNRTPICKCQSGCDDSFDPVCGNDGKTYINECILRLEACQTRKGLRTRMQGKCPVENPCHSVKCSMYQECEIDDKLPNVAECRCPTTCSKILKPVCGTDGVTYDSECELRRQSCLDRLNISVRYHGACNSATYCHQNHGICKHGAICHAIDLDDYSCVCPECSEEYSPVCGSNEVTYTNMCKFRKDTCEKKTTMITTQVGTCYGCENKNCRFYSSCQRGKCVCPQHCDGLQDPVCGSDLVTYPNECSLRAKACQSQKYIVIIKRGSCTTCKDVQCDYGARCEDGACVCPRKCPHHFDPVCGSNNITYDNECKVMAASCESTSKIIIKHRGQCERTASQYSEMHSATSGSSKNVQRSSSSSATGNGDSSGKRKSSEESQRLCDYNICKYSGTCVLDSKNEPKCQCNFTCPYQKNRICGNDGRVYDNECHFRQEICARQQEIKRKDFNFCRRKHSVPCDGDSPVKDSTSGKELNCHNSTCPAESYCHRNHDFAKCCPDMDYDESCQDTKYNCCPDGKTPSPGENQAGCPENCGCNRFGAILQRCDPATKRCFCKAKVTGKRCDRCEPGFWGLHKIAEGNFGCIACKCNKIGSARNDCEQMTGKCICKPGYKGIKCDLCPDGSAVEYHGCPTVSNTTCSDDSQCNFGSRCKNYICSCPNECSGEKKSPVCGNDFNLYDSECHLKLWSCKAQKEIQVSSMENCKKNKNSATTSPVRRSTEYQTTKHGSFGDLDEEDSTGDSFTGTTVPTLTTVEWELEHNKSPLFNGHTYVAFKAMAAYSKVLIHLKFIPFATDGIILFNSQTSTGEGDYLAVLMKNSYLEFRFNLGSGNVIIKSQEPVSLGKTVSVELGRHLSEGFMQIDDHRKENITGKSEGPHKLLDLGHHLFLGGLPLSHSKRLNDLFGINRNFSGCLQALEVNSEEYDWEDDLKNAVEQAGSVQWCGRDECSGSFCHGNGICVSNVPEEFQCECGSGFDGVRCQSFSNDLTDNCHGSGCQLYSAGNEPIIDFWNDSFVQLPTLQGVSQAFNIEVWLMARAKDGLVLYNGQSKGDFVELALVDGRVQYSFNLGGEKGDIVQITSPWPISLGDWHRIVISRKVKDGSLQIDDAPAIVASSKGSLNELNLDEPLFLGGIDPAFITSRRSSPSSSSSPSSGHQNHRGLNGALQRLIINGLVYRQLLARASAKVNVQRYEGPPCGYENPCFNAAKCLPWLSTYLCDCPDGYHGRQCEKLTSQQNMLTPIIVSDSVQFEYPQEYSRNLIIELSIKTTQSDALIFLASSIHKDKDSENYGAVTLVDGFVEYSQFNSRDAAGKRFLTKSAVRVNDSKIHNILVTRHKQIAILQIDQRNIGTFVIEDHNHGETSGTRDNAKISIAMSESFKTALLVALLVLLVSLLIAILFIIIKKHLQIRRLRVQLKPDYNAEVRNLNRQNETRVLLFPFGSTVQQKVTYSSPGSHNMPMTSNQRNQTPIFTTSF